MKFNPWHNEKRVTVTNHVQHFTKTHIVLKRGAESGRAWLKTGDEACEYPSVEAARNSQQMMNSTIPF